MRYYSYVMVTIMLGRVAGAAKAVAALQSPADAQVAANPDRLPNSICPSDHIPMLADIDIN